MDSQELLIEKFHACTGVNKEILKVWSKAENIKPNSDFHFKEFEQILANYSIGEYKYLIYSYLTSGLMLLEYKGRPTLVNEVLNNSQNLALDTIETFRYLTTGEDVEALTLKKRVGDNFPIKNKIVVNAII